jgi:serine phosphatase RsbU (regulator of sigma subunit)
VLAEANEILCTYIPANMFVTCFYAMLDPEKGTLSYANAGHTLPCRKRHDEDHADEIRARGMPLGLMPSMPYEEKETTLMPGDVVLFCTDGLVEAHDPRGEMFGSPRLVDLLSERSDIGRGLNAALMEELESFTGEGGEQEDDITLLRLIPNPVVYYAYAKEDRVVASCDHGRVGAPLQESEGPRRALSPPDRVAA